MAKITPSSIVGDIRGKLGYQVFQHSNGVISLRSNLGRKKTAPKRGTLSNLQATPSVKRVTLAWKTLSTSQVNAWNQAAFKRQTINDLFGNEIRLTSGFQYYCILNLTRCIAYNHNVPFGTPPSSPHIFAPYTFSIGPSTTQLNITTTDSEITSLFVRIWVYRLASPARKIDKTKLRMGVFNTPPSSPGTTSYVPTITGYYAVGANLMYQSTGEQTPLQILGIWQKVS